MASVTNRSNFVITVPKRGELTKHFPYNSKEAKPYFKSLEAQGYKPELSQLADAIAVRFRRRGQKDQTMTFGSFGEADSFIKRIESEQDHGLFIDYTSATNNVAFACAHERSTGGHRRSSTRDCTQLQWCFHSTLSHVGSSPYASSSNSGRNA